MTEKQTKNPLRIGIAGIGVVGGGAVEILARHSAMLASRGGRRLELAAISSRNKVKAEMLPLGRARWESDARALAAASDIDVVVETIGGAEGIAKELVEMALANGKSVVTANKALIAEHGVALAALAEKHGVVLAYEAAVAGGIPVIKAVREGLSANRIHCVQAILNATCNVILTTMEERGEDLEAVMDEAARMGLLEADPSLDVDGHDAAHKLTILSALCYGAAPNLGGVARVGIRAVTLSDIRYAKKLGYAVRLLAISSLSPEGLQQRVSPCLVPEIHPLAQVRGARNAIFLQSDQAGELMMQGFGGGQGPTASAIVADLVDLARGDHYRPFGVPVTTLAQPEALPISHLEKKQYFRFTTQSYGMSLPELHNLFNHYKLTITELREEKRHDGAWMDMVCITEPADEQQAHELEMALANHKAVKEKPLRMRIEP